MACFTGVCATTLPQFSVFCKKPSEVSSFLGSRLPLPLSSGPSSRSSAAPLPFTPVARVRSITIRSPRSGDPVPDDDGRRNLLIGGGAVLALGALWLASPDPVGRVARVDLIPTKGSSVKGQVTFSEVTSHLGAQYVRVDVDVQGLAPGKHGFHVHERGNVTCNDGLCTGGHFNPDGTKHGSPKSPPTSRHVGDLGNIEADKDGRVKTSILDSVIALDGAKSIVGRSVVVHYGEDDLVSQPVGNAGGRAAYGTIKLT